MDHLVYGIFNKKNGKIVYVGYTNKTLAERFKEHMGDKAREVKHNYLHKNECDVKLLSACSTKQLALSTETYYINYYQAPLNIQKISKHVKIQNAYDKCRAIIANLSKRQEKFIDIK